MGFEALLGNERLKENLTGSLSRGRISHFYLISGPEGSGKRTLALSLAAAIQCKGANKPCGRCSACRRVMENNHPDVITIDDPEHKTVAVRIVREAREDVFIRPNEADHKIYLFPQELGIEGQNALLKILEEPPPYGVFILLTDNPDKLLPTVRSRCTELALRSLPEDVLCNALAREFPASSAEDIKAAAIRSGGWLGQAKALLQDDAVAPQTENFVQAFASRDALLLTQTLAPMEKWKRDQLIPVLDSWIALMENALASRAGLPATSQLERTLSAQRSSQELMNALRSLRKGRDLAMGNISPGAICGWLQWELR
jgi:DNA polymerase-3 subunit delta'